MKQSLAFGIFLAAIITAPAHSQISVYIGTPPPPIRYEPPPPPPPAPDVVWMEGFWAPQGNHYRWIRGHYDHPPYPGAYWTHPHYDRYPQGWQIHEGHWDREDHDHGRGEGHAYGHDKDHGDHDDRSNHGHDRDHN
ncbi:YXWGXW repeat-containing protein [Tunturibacter empetritectus]|uniref:YXWGXW repeat-containing protein n=1 Tax=Tunturiibacter empetritectus TaxID=3069691 RepID=A0A7W8MPH7_9BACT|nr:YXWGXW repeat-containing protein [Edaphobacter lichenicola]MBB5315701.1 hypothetical protein [Edaphobacter lichenicola]